MALSTAPLPVGVGSSGDDFGSAVDKPHISAHFLHAAQQQLRVQSQQLRAALASAPANMAALLPHSAPVEAASSLAAFLQSAHDLRTHAAAPPPLRLAEWERSVLPRIVVLDAVELDAVRTEERRRRQGLDDDRAARTRQFVDKLSQLTAVEQQQLRATAQHFAGIARQLRDKERSMDQAALRMRAEQQQASSRLHSRLAAIVAAQKQAMADTYGRLHRSGDLSLAAIRSSLRSSLSLSPIRAALQSAAMSAAPRVLSIKVHALRAVKDKLPAGQYSLLVTLLPSIASPPHPAPLRAVRLRRLPLSHRSESVWVRHFDWTRSPARHSGKHHACELNFAADEDEMFIAAPAQQHAPLGSCLLIQLIAISALDEAAAKTATGSSAAATGVSSKRERLNLANNTQTAQHTYERYYRTDSVVAFGYLPLIQPHTRSLATGRLKLPLLRGDPRTDSGVTAHRHVAQRWAASLDGWLCNCYAELAELDGSWRDGYWVVDGDVAERQRKREREETRRQEERRQQLIDSKAKQMLRSEQQSAGWLGFLSSIKKQASPSPASNAATEKRSSIADKIDLIGRSIESMEMSAEGKQLHKRQQMRQRIKQLQQFRQSVIVNNHTHISRIKPTHHLRMLLAFIVQATWQDLRYKPGQAVYAAVNVVLLCGTWLLCHAIHYASQYWTLVSVLNVPVYDVDILYPLTVTFRFNDYLNNTFDPASLSAPQLLVCAIGPFGCYIFLAFLALLTSLLARCLPLPGLFYTASLFLCVHALLDPLSVLLVDALSGHWRQNEYVLLFGYYRQQQSPYAALLLTFVLLLALLSFGSALLAVYLLALHRQSEYSDLFTRLHSTEAELPLPADLEVSVRLVRRVMRDAAEYRGSRGTTRRVMVSEYIDVPQGQQADGGGEVRAQLTDEEDKRVHVSIFNVTKRKTVVRDKAADHPPIDDGHTQTDNSGADGTVDQTEADEQRAAQAQQDREQAVRDSGKEDRELWRQFVRLTDGTWIECLDGAESYGGEEMSLREMEWTAQREKDDRGGEEEEDRMRELREAEERETEQRQREHHKRNQQRKEEEEVAKGRVRATPALRAATMEGKDLHRKGSLRDGRVVDKDDGERRLRWLDDGGSTSADEERKEQSNPADGSPVFVVSVIAPTGRVVSSRSPGLEADEQKTEAISMLSPVSRSSVMGRTERMPSLLTTAIVENEEEEDD